MAEYSSTEFEYDYTSSMEDDEFHTKIEILSPLKSTSPVIKPPSSPLKLTPPPPTTTTATTPTEKLKIRYMGTVSNKYNTWVISLFVLLHIASFTATMLLNHCSASSHGDCSFPFLGRLSFQPLSENPLLGPSFSTLDTMGALRWKFLEGYHQNWRIFASVCLHAGAFHLIIDLSSLIFVGVHLEQKFGPWRIGLIYILSAVNGSLLATLFVQNTPAVCSSAALFGLIGASLSGLIRNWNLYADKCASLTAIFLMFAMNYVLGLLPYVDNFANIGGFVSGFLLGFVLFFLPNLSQKAKHNKGMFDYGTKSSVPLRQKLDRPLLRGISFIVFCLLFASLVLAVLRRVNVGKLCTWCHYLDCIHSDRWICEIIPTTCETAVSEGRLTITCLSNDHFRTLPFTDISPRRLHELCVVICSH